MIEKLNSPFSVMFGEEPASFISRDEEIGQIVSSFDSDKPESKVYVITGPRGSGKTVLLSKVKKNYEKKNKWITVDLNPYGDMLEQLCAGIYEKGKVKHLFIKPDFNFSFSGVSFSIHGDSPVSNVNTLLEKMFLYLSKQGVKVLITIDDISATQYVKYFIHTYQSFVREDYKIYLLISGLYENIFSLENDKSLTFLVRAPKIYLERLSLTKIKFSYSELLGVDDKTAIELAKLTMGYAYGYQLLGNLLYKNNLQLDDKLLNKYDMDLEDNVYSLIWRELSLKEKQILFAIASGSTSVADILKDTGMNNSALQVYKIRLSRAGIIDTSFRGQLLFNLPRFKEFVLLQKALEI